jgi:hypothetical protein
VTEANWEGNPYLQRIAEEITRNGFEPRPKENGRGSALTLYEAVRLAGRLDQRHALIRWANHDELQEAVGNVAARLDWALSESVGRSARAEPWSMAEGRTEHEVMTLIEAATSVHCPLANAALPTPVDRLAVEGVVGIGKYRGAISIEMSTRSSDGYGPLVARMLDQTSNGVDSALLRWLEAQPSSGHPDTGPFPSMFSRAAGVWLTGGSPPTIAGFCNTVASDWHARSDSQLIERLRVIIKS